MAQEYKVVPFTASIGANEGSAKAADQLEKLILAMVQDGWEYVRLESLETYVAGSSGCFGFGATSARMTSLSMVVFKR